MKLGILASEMDGTPTGVGRLLRGWLPWLSQLRPDWKFVLLFQGEPFEDPLLDDPGFETIFFSRPDLSPTLFEQWKLGRLLPELDAFFSPAYSLPRGLRCRSLVALHDLSFEVLPEEYGFRQRWRRRLLARRAARNASRVLTISPRIAAQLESLYSVSPQRIGILPLAVDREIFDGRPVDRPAGGPYALCVGSILDRRRPEVVIEAFEQIHAEHPEMRLVFAGPNRLREPERLQRAIDGYGLDGFVETLGFVSDDDLFALMQHAEFSVYVSTYEGYGLPPVESLVVGTPTIVSDGLALDFLWPEYPYRVAEIEAGEIASTARRILDDSGLRDRVLSEAQTRLAGLDWRSATEALLQEIERAVE